MKVGQRIVEIVFKGVDNTTGAFSGMQKTLGQMGKDVPALGAAFDLLKNPISLVTGAIVAMGAAIKKATDENIRLGASFQDMANRTGLSVEALAKWKFIADQNGATIDDFEMAFRKLRNTMADAATGNQQAVDIFKKLGVAATDADGNMRDLETVMLEIGQVIREHGVASIQGAAAMDAMGRSSSGMIAIIKQTPEALKLAQAEGRAYTSNMTSAWAEAADAADDAVARYKASLDNMRAKNTSFFTRFKADWNEQWSDVILGMTNPEAYKELFRLKQEQGAAAGRAFAEAITHYVVDGVKEADKAPVVDALAELAKKFNVAVKEKKWSVEKGAFIDVPRSADAIAADIIKAQEEGANKARESAALARMAAEAAAAAPPINLMSPEISFKMEAEDEKKAKAAFDDLIKQVLNIDLSDLNVIYGDPVEEAPKKMAETMKKTDVMAKDLAMSLSDVGATAIDAFLNGETGAMKFGDMIKRTITRAIAEAIVKLLVMKAITAALGGIGGLKDGGQPVKAALGGRMVPGFAAGGYAVPDGPRGMDSRLIMAMPGEEVINRRLSQRLERFVTSYEMGAAVSPFALSGAGGGRGTVINFNVARPVNVLDALTLGRDAVTASRKYSEARL